MLSSKAQNQSALMLTLMNQGNRKLMIRKHASYSQLWIPEQTSQCQIRIQIISKKKSEFRAKCLLVEWKKVVN